MIKFFFLIFLVFTSNVIAAQPATDVKLQRIPDAYIAGVVETLNYINIVPTRYGNNGIFCLPEGYNVSAQYLKTIVAKSKIAVRTPDEFVNASIVALQKNFPCN